MLEVRDRIILKNGQCPLNCRILSKEKESNRTHMWSTWCTYYTREFSERRHRTILPFNSQKFHLSSLRNSMLNSGVYENAKFPPMSTRQHVTASKVFPIGWRCISFYMTRRIIIYTRYLVKIALAFNDIILDEFRVAISLFAKVYLPLVNLQSTYSSNTKTWSPLEIKWKIKFCYLFVCLLEVFIE